jgi:hypothetical protein
MSAFYAFGSGALEQSLENKRAAAERKFELVKQIAPYALQNIDEQRKLLETEQKTKDTLSNVYTEQQQNVLYSLNPNLLYSTKPLEDAQALVQGFGADEVSAMEALNAAAESAEFDSGTQERLENYKDIYTNDIAGQLGLGQSTIDLQLGLRGQPAAQEPAPDMQTVEGEAMPMEQPVATAPPMADLAFGASQNQFFLDRPAGELAKLDYTNSPLKDVTEFPEWLDGSVDSDGQPVAQGTEGSITRRLYYELEANKLMQTSPEGNVAAMNDAKIDVEGVNELTPELISAINGVIANGNPGEIAEMKQFLIQSEIPYADRFPELNN